MTENRAIDYEGLNSATEGIVICTEVLDWILPYMEERIETQKNIQGIWQIVEIINEKLKREADRLREIV